MIEVTPTEADLEFVANWNADCRWCSEYDGDFAADFARDLAHYRQSSQSAAIRAALEAAAAKADDCAKRWGEQWRNRERDGGINGAEEHFQHGRLAGHSDGAATVAKFVRALSVEQIMNGMGE